MSNVLGIIAEYNPFHNGHLYHIKESIKQTDADYIVCIISGNFVQRGNTSIIDKWTKTKMAIAQGADLVLELPTIYATSSAENFAEGAIKIFDSLGIVNTLSFGIETKDLATLNNIANVVYQEPKEYVTMLNHELNKGVSFPKARENALMMYLNDIKRYANVLNGSNNILAIEYLKAIKKLKSPLKPVGIKREKVFFAELNLTSLLKYIKIKVNYETISKYPEVLRDLAITLDRSILVGEMVKEIKKKVNLIEKIDIFDVYSGDKIDKGKKSVAMSIVLRDKNRTLTDGDIDKAMTAILELIKDKYNGEIRK